MFEKVVVFICLVALANPALSTPFNFGTDKPNYRRPPQPVPEDLLKLLIPLQPVNETTPKNGRPILGSGKCNCGVKGASRIVGGAVAKANEWPWQAYLLVDDAYMCGGSLVSQNWIVTAAHCIKKKDSKISIYLGFINMNKVESAKHITMASSIIVHESYDSTTENNDIALVQLTTPVTYSAAIKPICLPYKFPKRDFQNEKATVTGWGYTSDGGSTSVKLKELTMPVLNKAQCTSSPYLFSSDDITDNMFCTYKEGSDACQGDSGGPLNWHSTPASRVFLIGVVSWGTGCAKKNYPGVYAKVNNYLTWIDNHTSETFCKP